MREFVQQHIGFRVAAQHGAVPTEVELRSSGTDRNAEPPGKCERVGVMRRRPRAGRTLGIGRPGDATEDRLLRPVAKLVGEAREHRRQAVGRDRREHHGAFTKPF